MSDSDDDMLDALGRGDLPPVKRSAAVQFDNDDSGGEGKDSQLKTVSRSSRSAVQTESKPPTIAKGTSTKRHAPVNSFWEEVRLPMKSLIVWTGIDNHMHKNMSL
jgi:hypothetical protein